MKIVIFCAVFNVFVLLVTSSDLSENAGEVENLSAKSKKIYHALPDAKMKSDYLSQKRDMNKLRQSNSELKTGKAFNEFLCATSKLKSQTEEVYPMFQGDWNSNLNKFLNGIRDEILFPAPDKVNRFRDFETQNKVKKHNRAIERIPNYFFRMFATLTKFYLEDHKNCLERMSYTYVDTIANNISPSLPGTIGPAGIQFGKAAMDFSARYAHIRHCYNIFSHHHHADGIDKTIMELVRQKKTKNVDQNIETKASPPIKINICEALEKMGILKIWQFTQDDLYVMNNISSAILPELGAIYFSHSCDFTIDGKTVTVLLPMTNVNNCPVFEEKTFAPPQN